MSSNENSATGQGGPENLPIYPFTMNNRWSLRNNMLSGITTPALFKILWRHRSAIEWGTYWHRILFLLGISIPNTVLGYIEDWLFRDKIKSQQLHPEPIFVLGHPRTGTTLLQNLLCEDPHFAYVDTFQAGFPSAFLLLRRFKWALAWLIDSTRPMDNMPLSLGTPAEDEIAVNMLTGGISPYMCVVFMTRYRDSLPYATFEGCPKGEREAWESALVYFLKKVTLAAGGGPNNPKPLIIKSPVHIGRLPILRALFPRAKFAFVHRHPRAVFSSSAILAQEYFTYCYLDRPTNDDITSYILEQHVMLYDIYLKGRGSLPDGSLSEVSFSELESDTMGTMRRVYSELNIPEFEERVFPILQRYCSNIDGFVKNDYRKLPPALEERLKIELAPVMDAFGYTWDK